MMHPKRILGIALCLLLALGADALAAGRHRKHGHSSTQRSSKQHREAAPSVGASGTASGRAGNGQTDAKAGDNRTPQKETARQESRIEFDERLLRGQSASGVIYLFQRTPSDWKSIVEVPSSFRDRTVNILSPTEDRK